MDFFMERRRKLGISTIQELTKKISQKQNGTNLTRLEIETVEIDPKQDLMSKWNNFSLYSLDSKKSIFKNANFKNEKEEKYTKSFYKYCKNFEKAKDMGIGILMYGNAGTGKTFLAVSILEDLPSNSADFLFSSLASLTAFFSLLAFDSTIDDFLEDDFSSSW